VSRSTTTPTSSGEVFERGGMRRYEVPAVIVVLADNPDDAYREARELAEATSVCGELQISVDATRPVEEVET
jgi:hypothetical protein